MTYSEEIKKFVKMLSIAGGIQKRTWSVILLYQLYGVSGNIKLCLL